MNTKKAVTVTSLRQLDALLAQHLFGWKWGHFVLDEKQTPHLMEPDLDFDGIIWHDKEPEHPHYEPSFASGPPDYTRHPSGEIWAVVEKMQELGFALNLKSKSPWREGSQPSASFAKRLAYEEWFSAPTPELAIALAALSALGHPVELRLEGNAA